ncbi:MAG: hypothetical protein ACREXM_12165 [Gammaproteobacteria bacterium]
MEPVFNVAAAMAAQMRPSAISTSWCHRKAAREQGLVTRDAALDEKERSARIVIPPQNI